MKVSGIMMSFMEKGKSTMITGNSLKEMSITFLSKTFNFTGWSMTVTHILIQANFHMMLSKA